MNRKIIVIGTGGHAKVLGGENAIINTCASIDHDCIIGKHCHIAPGVLMGGGVAVHDDAHIWSGRECYPRNNNR